MQERAVRGSQRGVTQTEYAIIVAAVSLVVMTVVGVLGGQTSDPFCDVNRGLGFGGDCARAAQPADDAGAAAPGTGAGEGSSSGAAGGGSPASGTGGAGTTGTGTDEGAATDPGSSASGTSDQASTNADGSTNAAAAPNSSGKMTFYTAVVDQDQRKRDLSARFNLGWFPDSWNDVKYPESLTMDVTWSPALDVDQVITGNSGSWDYTLVSPGHLRLTYTGAVTTSGFNPQPEILLTKSSTTEKVTVNFTAEAPNTPPVSATSSTTSVPYK